jgi:competence protein ComEC
VRAIPGQAGPRHGAAGGVFAAAVLAQRGALFPWVPVVFALGIALFYAAPAEPPLWLLGLAGVLALLAGGLALRADAVRGPCLWAVALLAAGVSVAGLRAHLVATPVLDFRYYGAIEGTVTGIDRSRSGAVRVTLSEVRLSRMAPERIPRKLRLSLHGEAAQRVPRPGARVMTTGHLMPPSGPTEPGGFDFQRHAWHLGLGAIGYSRVPLLPAAAPPESAGVFGLRMALSAYVQAQVSGKAGGFAAAITTGDRSGLDPAVSQALRDTNLAHLLAISGLHMGLLTGFIFAALRVVLAPLALWLPTRKLAAAGALAVGAVYLALSGGNVATERAFVMVAVALCAVLLDRRAISLRSVAVAALIVLTLRPEALLAPGFQLSFAATVTLVAAFRALVALRLRDRAPLGTQPILAFFVSATVAGLATLPIAAAHFNRMASWGLIANLTAPPVMGTIVAPAGVLAALLAPFGLDWIGFWIMAQGLSWIILVAETISAWPGSVRFVPAPPGAVLPLLALGGLAVVLMKGRVRWAGVAPMLAGLALWAADDRPAVLVADTGGLVGVMTDEGRALSRARASSFVARTWLENDGQGLDQPAAAALWPGDDLLRVWPVAGGRIVHAPGKRALARLESCDADTLLVTTRRDVADLLPPAARCEVLGPQRLAQTGSLALSRRPDGWSMTSAAHETGRRMWNDAATRRVRAADLAELEWTLPALTGLFPAVLR